MRKNKNDVAGMFQTLKELKNMNYKAAGSTIETSDGGRVELSPLAKKLRNEHSAKYKQKHPDKARRYVNKHWENVAREIFGKEYKAPNSPDEMSEHAKEARRRYIREYQRKHPEKTRRYGANYWERKAREQIAEIEAIKGE